MTSGLTEGLFQVFINRRDGGFGLLPRGYFSKKVRLYSRFETFSFEMRKRGLKVRKWKFSTINGTIWFFLENCFYLYNLKNNRY